MYQLHVCFSIDLTKTKPEEIIGPYREHILSFTSKQKGFIEAKFLLNTKDGQVVSQYIWESAEANEEGTRGEEFTERKNKFVAIVKHLFVKPLQANSWTFL
jgi:heme-degrading monooxygenase HmoA